MHDLKETKICAVHKGAVNFLLHNLKLSSWQLKPWKLAEILFYFQMMQDLSSCIPPFAFASSLIPNTPLFK